MSIPVAQIVDYLCRVYNVNAGSLVRVITFRSGAYKVLSIDLLSRYETLRIKENIAV